MSFTAKRHEVEEGVRTVLKIDPHIADGPKYRKLILLYWCYVDRVFTFDRESGYYYTSPEEFEKATSPEAIGRAFRRLVVKEVAKLTPETETRRREMEKKYRLYHSGRDPDADDDPDVIDHRGDKK